MEGLWRYSDSPLPKQSAFIKVMAGRQWFFPGLEIAAALEARRKFA